MSHLLTNCFIQTFKKVEGYEQTSVEDAEEWLEPEKDLKHDTLFDEDISRTETDGVQYENDIYDDDSVNVDIAKFPLRVKALLLALPYV